MKLPRMLIAALAITTTALLLGCGSATPDDGTAEFGGADREKRQKMMEKTMPAEQKAQPAEKSK